MIASWKAVIVLVSSWALLAFLVWLKTPGAAVAALAAVIATINWFTQGGSSAKTGKSLFPPPMPPSDTEDPPETKGPLS